MRDLQVTSVDRDDHGTIVALHGPWGRASVNLAVLLIGSGSAAFYVDAGDGSRVYVTAVGGVAALSLSLCAEDPVLP